MIDSPELLNRIHIRVPQRLTRQHKLFAINFHRTDYRMNSPNSRMCELSTLNVLKMVYFVIVFLVWKTYNCCTLVIVTGTMLILILFYFYLMTYLLISHDCLWLIYIFVLFVKWIIFFFYEYLTDNNLNGTSVNKLLLFT